MRSSKHLGGPRLTFRQGGLRVARTLLATVSSLLKFAQLDSARNRMISILLLLVRSIYRYPKACNCSATVSSETDVAPTVDSSVFIFRLSVPVSTTNHGTLHTSIVRGFR